MNDESPYYKDEDIVEGAKSVDCFEDAPTMGSQILYRAIRYRDVQWNATASNAPNGNMSNCTTKVNIRNFCSPPLNYDYYVTTPTFYTTISNTGMYYKWGGFTHINNYISEINAGKIVGDTEKDGDECNFALDINPGSSSCGYEQGDTHVIGVDCSGLVCRAWKRQHKLGTTDGDWGLSTISHQLTGFNLLRRGDIINKSGSHVCIVRDNNSTTTRVEVIEAHGTGRVRNRIYSGEMLQDYVPRRYNQKDPFDLHFQNFQITQSPIYTYGPISLSVQLSNVGTGAFTGYQTRAMVYPNYADANTDVLGEPLFQIGATQTPTVGVGANATINFNLQEVPPAIQPGTYLVAIEFNRNGCWAKIPRNDFVGLQQITIEPAVPPVADFTYSPTVGDFPLSVQFTDASTGNPTEWSWSFGDGGTSIQQNPSHEYSSPGTYTVSLTVNKNGLTDTETKQIVLTEGLNALFTANPTSGNVPLTVQFTDISTGSPTQWQWNFGDGSYSSSQNPSKIYSTTGSYQVTLTVQKGDQSSTSQPQTINVYTTSIQLTGNVKTSGGGFQNISGAKVTLVEDDQITYTDYNGNFIHTIPYGWYGTIRIEKEGFQTYQQYIEAQYDNINMVFYLNPIPIFNFVWEKIGSLRYKFTASCNSIIEQYQWSFETEYGWEVVNSILPTCEFTFYSNGTWDVCLEILTLNDGFIGPVCKTIDVGSTYLEANYSYINNQDVFRLGQLAKFIDLSGPFSNVGMATIQIASNYTTFIRYKKEETIYCANANPYPSDRILSVIYTTAGYKNSLFNVTGLNCSTATPSLQIDLNFLIVDCSQTTNSTYFLYTAINKANDLNNFYSGKFDLNSSLLSGLINANNKKIGLLACDELVLKPGFNIAPSGNNYLHLKIDPMLQDKIPKSSSIFSENHIDEYFNSSYTINNKNKLDLIIYPNPTTSSFVVELKSDTDFISSIEVVNSVGALVDVWNNVNNFYQEINLSNEPDGLYIVRAITTNGNVYTTRVIKLN